MIVRAEGDSASVIGVKTPPVVTWPSDNETIKDVFAFAGPLPEVRLRF